MTDGDGVGKVGRAVGAVIVAAHLSADHHALDLVRRRLRGGDRAYDLAVAQDGDGVRDAEHLLHVVGDDDGAAVLRLEAAEQGVELFAVIHRERLRHLVEQQDIRLERERAGELNHLARLDEHRAGARVQRRHGQVPFFKHRLRRAVQRL